ncbi:MAG: hypothetical protein JXR94_04120 [Candidatus Hydrogenedentes bacterium]|nr:hypothetical protein [Candidatus Hydrogenedentota bacterium]
MSGHLVLARFLIGFALAGASAAEAVGPFTVCVADEVLLPDAARGKSVPLKVYFPEEAGVYPLVLFSHGAGDSNDGAAHLSWFWASHGYVCIHPTHGVDGAARHRLSLVRTWRELRRWREEGAEAWAGRVADLELILDRLDDVGARVPGLAGKIDRERIGVAGHSLGAYTALLVGGAELAAPDGAGPIRYTDGRVRAVVALSPPGVDERGLNVHSWCRMRLPVMIATGSRDVGLRGGQGVRWRTDAYRFAPPGDKYLLFIEGATHASFVGMPASGAPRNPGRPKPIMQYTRAATLAFWNAYLKGDPAGAAYLKSPALAESSGGKAALYTK